MRIPGIGEIPDIDLMKAESQRQLAEAQALQQRLITLAAERHAHTHRKLDRIIELLAEIADRHEEDPFIKPVITYDA
jgi:hypothetical protein